MDEGLEAHQDGSQHVLAGIADRGRPARTERAARKNRERLLSDRGRLARTEHLSDRGRPACN